MKFGFNTWKLNLNTKPLNKHKFMKVVSLTNTSNCLFYV